MFQEAAFTRSQRGMLHFAIMPHQRLLAATICFDMPNFTEYRNRDCIAMPERDIVGDSLENLKQYCMLRRTLAAESAPPDHRPRQSVGFGASSGRFSFSNSDIEMRIVHELVHLELASLPRSQASRSTEEHAVNGLAEALLALDRSKQ